uniref:Uncharacterized protein n=1 Tax=Asparagus officinalis TaxID=4686 RepID=Q2XNW3_ASPOF|nr:hypothetical protein 12.t00016 [Asparagus officinalis]
MGANSLSTEAVVPQPQIKILVVEEVEYEFDQAKLEEYLSSSSSRSSSSRKYRKISTSKKAWDDSRLIIAKASPRNAPPASKEDEISDHNAPIQTCLTLKEHIQKCRACALARKAQDTNKDKVAMKPPKPHQEWRPKSKIATQTSAEAPENCKPAKGGSAKAEPPQANPCHGRASSAWPSLASPPAAISEFPPASVPVQVDPVPLVKAHDSMDLSRFKMMMIDHLGPLYEDRGKASVKECLGPENTRNHPLGVACPGSGAREDSTLARGIKKSRKRSIPESDSHYPCERLIMVVLSECRCPKIAPRRVSVFERISTKVSKSKSRCFYKKKYTGHDDEMLEVTINVADKGKSIRCYSPDSFSEASQRIAWLRS